MRYRFCGLLLLPNLAAAVSPPAQPVLPTYQLVEALGTADVYASLAINLANDQPQVAFIDITTPPLCQARSLSAKPTFDQPLPGSTTR